MRMIIIGAGNAGRLLGRYFSRQTEDVVVIDRLPERLAMVEEEVDAMTVEGEATHRKVLRTAGVEDCALLIAATSSDATNLVAAALAREMGARSVLARVDDPAFYDTPGIEYGVLGVDAIFCGGRIAANEILRATRALETSFAANLAGVAGQALLCPVHDPSPLRKRPVADVHLGAGAAIRGVVRDDFLIGPEEAGKLELDDQVLVVGPLAAIPEALRRLKLDSMIRSIVVVGGGYAGAQLCGQLARTGVRVQVIERDRERAAVIAERLSEVTVLHGDGTSLDFLSDVQAGAADLLVGVTHDDEANLMTGLLARYLGVPHAFTIVRRSGYTKVYQALGIDEVVSRYEVLSEAMIDTVMRGRIHRETLLPPTQHLLAELAVPPSIPRSDASRRRLGDIALPVHGHLVAHVRGTRMLPLSPGTQLHGADVVVVATLPRYLTKLHAAMRDLT